MILKITNQTEMLSVTYKCMQEQNIRNFETFEQNLLK